MSQRPLEILDYGCGNVGSLVNIFRHIGKTPKLVCEPENVSPGAAIVLPGVGNFAHCMGALKSTGFDKVVLASVERGDPLLGICVGMQMLFDKGEEGDVDGLGFIPGAVKMFDKKLFKSRLPLPNVGWHYVESANEIGRRLCRNMPARPKFYHVHSYHAHCADEKDVIFCANYGYRFTTGVAKGKVTGFQFHPEKSHAYGMNLLSNWVEITNE